MKPRPVTDWDLEYLGPDVRRVKFGAPADGSVDAETVEVAHFGDRLMVPFVTDDRDLPSFEGTVWITIYGGGMPPIDAYVMESDGVRPEAMT